MSRHAPIAFASYASYVARTGHIQLGSRLTATAQLLMHRLGAHEFAGQILFVSADIQCCMQPVLAANDSRIDGERLSLSVGDVHYACFHRLAYVITLFWSGVKP